MPGYPPVRDGDWTCTESDCKASNFARRTECFKCGKERDFKAWKKQKMKEIGGSEAKKSGGLFSADDWRCNKCGNINWARRNTCNMCNAPKVEDDERTGFGGGFNDRQDVEYIDRDSSGDEIDDFGRKKKKFRSVNDDKPRKEVLRPGFGETSREAEEDDDDDDDEEDASKYNLDDDTDEEESSPSKETSKKSSKDNKTGKKRRSSSSSSASSSASSKSSSSSSSNSRRKSGSRSKSRSRSRRSRSRDQKKKDSRKSSPSQKKTSSSRRRSRSPSSSRRKSRSSSRHSHSKSRRKRSR